MKNRYFVQIVPEYLAGNFRIRLLFI